MALAFCLVIVLLIATPEASRRNTQGYLQDGQPGAVPTRNLPMSEETRRANPLLALTNGSLSPGNPVATQDAKEGIIDTPLPTDTPPPMPTSTPRPTHDPAILACVATVEARPNYPTPYPTYTLRLDWLHTPYERIDQRILDAQWYMLSGLPGRVIATGKQSPDATPDGFRDIKLESYRVVEVTLPCPMSFDYSSNHIVAQRLWWIDVVSTDSAPVGNAAYETCIDGQQVRGPIFDPSILREGSTISYGLGNCSSSFTEKLHFTP